jgi:hypothetical protein
MEHIVPGPAEEFVVPSLPAQQVVTLGPLRPGSRGSEPKADQIVERRPLHLHEAQVAVVTLDLSSRHGITTTVRRDATEAVSQADDACLVQKQDQIHRTIHRSTEEDVVVHDMEACPSGSRVRRPRQYEQGEHDRGQDRPLPSLHRAGA